MTCADFLGLCGKGLRNLSTAELGALWKHRRTCQECFLVVMSAAAAAQAVGRRPEFSADEINALADKIVADPESGFADAVKTEKAK